MVTAARTLAIPSSSAELQRRLLLVRFLCSQLGAATFEDLQASLRGTKEGWEVGVSHFVRVLLERGNRRTSDAELLSADAAIGGFLDRINRARTPPVTFRYFQYLAVLFSHIYLRPYFADPAGLAYDLNAFAAEMGSPYSTLHYSVDDLRKLAFWMATGSGKTLVMHCNVLQYLSLAGSAHSHRNILLITPDEMLSRQHLREFAKSGIDAIHYLDRAARALPVSSSTVTVIEIQKLVEQKRGAGVTVEVAAFGEDNLVLVDEGHRGARGEVWRSLRQRLSRQGFAFEYSATFGQIALVAEGTLLVEYAKATVFEYSYRRFYEDGFGKDYWVANVDARSGATTRSLLLGNLLSFYEQCLAFDESGEKIRRHLEPPLWVHVGHSVTSAGRTQDDKESLTDVENVVRFLDWFTRSTTEAMKELGRILDGRSGIKADAGRDLYASMFPLLRRRGMTLAALYDGIVGRIFGSDSHAHLIASNLRLAPGEIGLRLGEGPYFGVIYVGEDATLATMLGDAGIEHEDDHISLTKFGDINDPFSTIRILIGSRKFMEGWDSFRVSSMALLNIGRNEGTQVIQLFGRGVRLHGAGYSLKRATADGGVPPVETRLIETLNVFGVRANYMEQFRNELLREGISADIHEYNAPVIANNDLLSSDLQILELPLETRFDDEVIVLPEASAAIEVKLDLTSRVTLTESTGGSSRLTVEGIDIASAVREALPAYDWKRICDGVERGRQRTALNGVVLTESRLRGILSHMELTILAAEGQFDFASVEGLSRVENLVIDVLLRYIQLYYARQRSTWERSRFRLGTLTSDNANFPDAYRVRSTSASFIKRLKQLVAKADQLYRQDIVDFPIIHLDQHLYQPLFVQDRESSFVPMGLNDGERTFVVNLRSELQDSAGELRGDVFVLRNLTRGKGLGFFDEASGTGFYPDFLMWSIDNGRQHLVFVDPKGLGHMRGGLRDPKIQLFRELEGLGVLEHEGKQASFTSFIVSTTAIGAARKSLGKPSMSPDEFAEHHIVFTEDKDAIKRLLAKVGFLQGIKP